ncbi:MAG TPA: arginine--tRNA ligase [Solirubrobacteraceae bacterium]|nr:arginine--tRNA ligase [Solirubrobacteraceae bacterium]
MAAPASDPLKRLAAAVSAAAASVRDGAGGTPVDVKLERPKRAGQGDYSTNAAMLLAPAMGAAPRQIAERIGTALEGRLSDDLARVEIAGPGFLNVFLNDGWHRRTLGAVVAAGGRYGAGGAERAERLLIEFVSSNPTGPLVAAAGRHGAYGDALARILEHHGHDVAREYYFNDAGNQIRLLGASVQARARGEEVPEGGYQGDYVHELAEQIPDAAGGDVDVLARAAVELMLGRIKSTLERYGIHFDRFFSERVLHEGEPNAVQRAIAGLEAAGHIYRSEGATWLRTTSFGDDKDRVVIRSDGTPTYLAADIAYLEDKRARGFERQLIPVGSDHDTWAKTMKRVMRALGADPDTLDVPLIQFVHLVSGGESARMSKRRGEFVTLDELLDEIGVDATRFFMLRSSHDRTLDLDLDLARKQSRENPVYYVQYAHARIASMLARVDAERRELALSSPEAWGTAALEPAERELIKQLAGFPEEVAEAAARRAPHRMAAYALALAQDFTAFYEHCRVVGAEPAELEAFRIALSAATQRVIALALGLLGVSAPESM